MVFEHFFRRDVQVIIFDVFDIIFLVIMVFGIAPGHIHVIPFPFQLHKIPRVRPAPCGARYNDAGNVQPVHQILHGTGISLAYGFPAHKHADNILVVFRIQIIVGLLNEHAVNIAHLLIIRRIRADFFQIGICPAVDFFLHPFPFLLCHNIIRRKGHGLGLPVSLILRIAEAFHPEQPAVICLDAVKNLFQLLPVLSRQRHFFVVIHNGIQHLVINDLVFLWQRAIRIPVL